MQLARLTDLPIVEIGVHMRRLNRIDVIFKHDMESVERTVNRNLQEAVEMHGRGKSTLLDVVTLLQLHYQDSFHVQRDHFQVLKEEIINQAIHYAFLVQYEILAFVHVLCS